MFLNRSLCFCWSVVCGARRVCDVGVNAVFVSVCRYVWVYVCMTVSEKISKCVRMMCVRECAYVCVSACACMSVCMCVSAHMYMYELAHSRIESQRFAR